MDDEVVEEQCGMLVSHKGRMRPNRRKPKPARVRAGAGEAKFLETITEG